MECGKIFSKIFLRIFRENTIEILFYEDSVGDFEMPDVDDKTAIKN